MVIYYIDHFHLDFVIMIILFSIIMDLIMILSFIFNLRRSGGCLVLVIVCIFYRRLISGDLGLFLIKICL